jgi:hypothetical protein
VVQGWESFCVDAACADGREVVGDAQARLRDSRIQGNLFGGAYVDAGGLADLDEVTVRGNGAGASGPGVVASTRSGYLDLGPAHEVNAPALLRARGTVFQGNAGPGVQATVDARLDLGGGHEGGENSFLGNAGGSIWNQTPNPVNAERNWFGTKVVAEIQASIQDCKTNAAWGCVDFTPFLTHPE